MAQEFRIEESDCVDGEYVCDIPNGDDSWEADDLIEELRMNGDVFELGVDALPDGVEDIRGRIHDEPSRVLWAVDFDGFGHYIGVA